MIPAVYTISPAAVLDDDASALFPGAAYFAGNLLLIALQGTEVIGVVGYRQLGGDEAELLFMGTNPDHRRRGVATALLREVLRRCPGTVFLEVRESNHGARALYRSAGFEEIGIRQKYYNDPPENAIVMKFHS